MSSVSRFSTGFERDFFEQTLNTEGAAVSLIRGDSLVYNTPQVGKAGVTAMTLAAPLYVGQELWIYCLGISLGGQTVVMTSAVALNAAGNTVMTFNGADDSILLIGVTGRWQVVVADSVALS